MQVSACVTVLAAAIAGPIIIWKSWPQEAAAAPTSKPVQVQSDPRLEPVSREPLETQDRYQAQYAAESVAQDQTWYAVAQDDCYKLNVAMGVDTPEQARSELNARGGRFDYFKRTDNMVGLSEPLGERLAFVRGYGRCRVVWGAMRAEN
jgi:hypothetical protein